MKRWAESWLPQTLFHEAGVVQTLLRQRGLMSDHEHGAGKTWTHTMNKARRFVLLCRSAFVPKPFAVTAWEWERGGVYEPGVGET